MDNGKNINGTDPMLKKRKQDKFLKLLKPVTSNLERYALAMTRNREEAKDVVGETIMIAYESFGKLKDESAFLSFLFTIATRVYNKRQRAFVRFRADDKQDVDELYCNTLPPDVAADIRILYSALDKLPGNQREAIILFDIFGLPHKEICTIQDTSLSSVKMRILRGKKKLAVLLGEDNKQEAAIKLNYS